MLVTDRPEKIIAENLRKRRKEKGWSQRHVADRIHVDRTTYSKYESGKTDPPLEKCIFLCIVMDMSPNQLMGWGSGAKSPVTNEPFDEKTD